METTSKTALKIKSKLGIKQYSFTDFLVACPFSLNELKQKNRKDEIVYARHVGMTWLVLSGKTLRYAGEMFGLDHATALNSTKRVLSALENPKQYPEIINLISGIKTILPKKDFGSPMTNEPESLVIMQEYLNRKWYELV